MGTVEPCFTLNWPYGNYGIIPGVWHPMYMGQVYAQLALHYVPAMRERYPLLVPIHCCLFFMVIAQELFDFHAGKPVKYQAKKVE